MHTARLEGQMAVFRTDTMIAEVGGGILTRLFNRITGTEYLECASTVPRGDMVTGMVYATPGIATGSGPNVVGPTPSTAGSQTLVPQVTGLTEFRLVSARESKDGIEFAFESTGHDTHLALIYDLDPETGDLLVRQRGIGSRRGVMGVRLGLGPVTCRGNLLLPAFNGIKANRGEFSYQFESPRWDWPSGWQLALLIFQDPAGGMWVHSEDAEGRFKTLDYCYAGGGTWYVALDTVNAAPFPSHDRVDGVAWRINVYKGDWSVPIRRYKQWAYGAYEMKGKEKSHPRWVRDIRLVIRGADKYPDEEIKRVLDALGRYVDPAKTLLFLENWTEDQSDTPVIPHWVAGQRGIRFNREARTRGFRTIYFSNYHGITPNHPRIEEFKAYVVRNPLTGDLEGWNLKGEWSDLTPIKLYYVSPACKAWRDYQVGMFKTLFDAYPADGLFLDQSYLVFNDGNGLVDGQTCLEGNLAFHRELLEAIPGIALGGESIQEITFQYQALTELHYLSIQMSKDQRGKDEWLIDPAAFDRMVPLVPAFLDPFTRPIGYLGFPPTESSFYPGWRDSVRAYQGIPTLRQPQLHELEDPESEVRRLFLEAMASE